MTYVVTENCIDCVHTDCVEVCPTDAFHDAITILYINPESCIDCDACVDVCPETAIFADLDVPDKWKHWIAVNAKESLRFPVIREIRKTPALEQ